MNYEKIAQKCLARSVMARAQKNSRNAAAWERARKSYQVLAEATAKWVEVKRGGK